MSTLENLPNKLSTSASKMNSSAQTLAELRETKNKSAKEKQSKPPQRHQEDSPKESKED